MGYHKGIFKEQHTPFNDNHYNRDSNGKPQGIYPVPRTNQARQIYQTTETLHGGAKMATEITTGGKTTGRGTNKGTGVNGTMYQHLH